MKRDILIIAYFTHLPWQSSNGRFHYLARLIDKKKADVEIVTTDFSHGTKKHISATTRQLQNSDYTFTMIHEPGYCKNISIRRYYSHHLASKNLKKYLRARKKPDLIYCAVPPPNFAEVAAQYATRNDIPFIIDVQDIWPEAYKMFFDKPPISDWLFSPVEKAANYVYNAADAIIAVSKTYAERAVRANQKCHKPMVVFLGTELKTFDEMAERFVADTSKKQELWLGYVGSLSHSYDIPCVIDALSVLKEKGVKDIKFVVMGDGPLRAKYEQYAESKGIWTDFTGRLDYGKMVGLLSACDIAVNPIMKNSGGSIINKHADYAAAGLPILNTQESHEYRELVNRWGIGFNCYNGDAYDLADKLGLLYGDAELRRRMGNNSRQLAKSQFDRAKTYRPIAELLETGVTQTM